MANPTPEQEAMRLAFEKWADANGMMLWRVWNAPESAYRNDDTQAAWEAWQAASAQLSALRAQVDRLRKLAAACYAGLGAECALPDEWLDVLLAAAEGEPFSDEGLLPFESQLRKSHAELLEALTEQRVAYEALIPGMSQFTTISDCLAAQAAWAERRHNADKASDAAIQHAKELQA